ncbi:MAG: hypothetical protein K0Q55_2474 [Verrucomicrobia bacterium]|jgi:RNA polymerase sigma factor (sigma-70 family)|nr:hypothetical protein [Verrucomicrobiota bacterium]
MSETQQLLAAYVENGSETAFRELVSRHVNLVYATALRLVGGDAHRAQEVAQTVFVQLAQNAHKLSRESTLGGWLHRTTCNVASKALRTERRRIERETQAMLMNAQSHEGEARMERVAPILDEAINQLGEEDRAAIVLRFFEQRDFRAVGLALGSGEDAARMRVNRALEKLQSMLKRKGVALSATALGTMLTAGAVSAAPAGLSVSLAGAAFAAATKGGGTSIGMLTLMNQFKVGIAGAIVVTGLAGSLFVQHRSAGRLQTENDALRKQTVLMQEEMDALKRRPLTAPAQVADQDRTELLRLRGEVGVMRGQMAAVNKENERLVASMRQQAEKSKTEQYLAAEDEAKAVRNANLAKRLGLALHIYRGKHNEAFPDSFEQLSAAAKDVLGADSYAQFELFPLSGKLSELPNPSKTIVLKGGLFQMSSGKWTMAYGMADGSVQRLASSAPDFGAEEKRVNFVYPSAEKTQQ